MPDNWAFVLAAYGLTALVLGLYWRHLVRKEHALDRRATQEPTALPTGSARAVAGATTAPTERARDSFTADRGIAERSRQPSRPGQPRTDPTSRGPLQ